MKRGVVWMKSGAGEKSFRYIPGFDGLRALAVLAVIAYHLNFPYSAGGFLGVTVFFVVSGFLITSLLLWEWEQTQKIDLKSFWIRRAKRLLPAMFLLLISLNVVVPLLKPALLTSLRQDTIAAIFYYSNWHYIFQDLSYFESYEHPSLLTHFWSLAIEEQFYILWAVAILFLLRKVKNRKGIFLLIMGGALMSVVQMLLLYDPNLDPSRVYYGTDTRIFSLLIGASFALLVPHQPLSTMSKWALELLGIAGISVFLLMTVFTNQYDSFIYEGGMVLLSFTTAFLVLALAWRSAVIANWILECKPLKWIGIRSYGIYLWHYPVILFMNSNVNTGGIHYGKVILELTLTFLLAAISYRFVEKPIRQGNFRFRVKNSLAIATSIVLLFGLTNYVWVTNKNVGASVEVSGDFEEDAAGPSGKEDIRSQNEEDSSQTPVPNSDSEEEKGQTPDQSNDKEEDANKPPQDSGNEDETANPPPAQNNDKEEVATKPPDDNGNEEAITNPLPAQNNKPPNNNGTQPPVVITEKITAIGDSVLINPGPLLQKAFPNITVDGKVSRQMRDAYDIVNQLKKANQLGDIVIIQLGTNGPFPDKTLTSLIDLIGKERKILLVNVRVPRPWESIVNKTLMEVAEKYSHTTIVDWYATSANHNEYFVSDGVHLKPAGSKAFAAMIESAVQKVVSSRK
jgi:peptidoglycan/LPS O-acetylase OafA/YrhL/lysophospholipase L1-like esterase